MPKVSIQHTASLSCEATALFDGVDRWKIAQRFGIDHVHERTRLQIYERIADGRDCGEFQEVIAEIAGMDPKRDRPFIYVNWDEFTNDLADSQEARNTSLKPLTCIQRWLRDVIARHCPFVQPSLDHGRIWLSAIPASQTRGEELFRALRQARDAFREISDPNDRNNILNAFVLAVPTIPGLRFPGSVREYLGEYRQDFGETEIGKDITIGSFVPAEPVSAIADPRREAPPAFVFRHSMLRQRHLPNAPIRPPIEERGR